MGQYMNVYNDKSLPAKGKAEFLLNEGATKVTGKIEFQENLVCVVDNYHFDAAAYAFSEEEMKQFLNPYDNRPKTWLIVPNAAEFATRF